MENNSTPQVNNEKQLTGEVVQFLAKQRFGYIRIDGENHELFFQMYNWTESQDPKIGDRVVFHSKKGASGLRAINIRLIRG